MENGPDIMTSGTSAVPSAPLRLWRYGTLGVLCLGFARPLYQLLALSLSSELYSHVLLIPFISGYFVWQKHKSLPPASRSVTLAVFLAVAGFAFLATFWMLRQQGHGLLGTNGLSLCIPAFLLLLGSWAAYFFGAAILRDLVFPILFLVFLIPMPDVVEHGVEAMLQQGSAWVAYGLFTLSGTPLLRDGLLFHLPGISLEIAPECSGIRSSLALFITAIVAGQWYLRSPSKRALLALAVLPLAVLRNGVRVFTIGELCVHLGPQMIDSFLHRHGGPVFFAASLIPFGLLLLALLRLERQSPESHS